jgi:hypothetical protein
MEISAGTPWLMIAARASRPEECDRAMAVSRGDVGMADGVIWFEMGSACCVGDSRSPWRAEAAGKQTRQNPPRLPFTIRAG